MEKNRLKISCLQLKDRDKTEKWWSVLAISVYCPVMVVQGPVR